MNESITVESLSPSPESATQGYLADVDERLSVVDVVEINNHGIAIDGGMWVECDDYCLSDEGKTLEISIGGDVGE